jgi:hypothetical protein
MEGGKTKRNREEKIKEERKERTREQIIGQLKEEK